MLFPKPLDLNDSYNLSHWPLFATMTLFILSSNENETINASLFNCKHFNNEIIHKHVMSHLSNISHSKVRPQSKHFIRAHLTHSTMVAFALRKQKQ